jgi:hypothetical protein
MKRKKICQIGSIFAMVIALTLCRSGQLAAQSLREIKGIVTDSLARISLPGVNVMVKGTGRGVSTDASGAFALEASGNEVLVFSFIGYEKKEITVGSQ